MEPIDQLTIRGKNNGIGFRLDFHLYKNKIDISRTTSLGYYEGPVSIPLKDEDGYFLQKVWDQLKTQMEEWVNENHPGRNDKS